jgi:tRNA modification GTPase
VHVFIFRAPKSYTREDLAEIHIPAGRPVSDDILAKALNAGARLAEPGEFTRRAFENGRISLAAAEGVLSLITAQERSTVRAGMRLLSGEDPAQFRDAVNTLKCVYTELVASLDFSEEDIEFISKDAVAAGLSKVIDKLSSISREASVQGGIRVVLLGEVNAGKTTLFNSLAGQDAIVSDVPGTTRDALHARLCVAGREVTLIDLPGLAARDEFAPLTSSVSQRETSSADIVLLCVAADSAKAPGEEILRAVKSSGAEGLVIVATKSDVARTDAAIAFGLAVAEGADREVFAVTHTSLDDVSGLRTALDKVISAGGIEAGVTVPAVIAQAAARGLALVKDAMNALEEDMLDASASLIEGAIVALEAPFVPGREIDEATLTEIFSRFCVGK